MIRVLHTADVHLGRKFPLLGDSGRTVRAQLRETFRAVLALGQARSVSAVLIAGDLFDASRPDASDVQFMLHAIAQIRPLPVVVLPGTHDFLTPASIWATLADAPENLHVVTQDPWRLHIPAASLTIHGRPNRATRGGDPPLVGLAPDPQARCNVALAHASVARGDVGSDPDHDYFVSAQELDASGMQYLALGHWHTAGPQLPEAHAVAWYAGPPEPVQFPDADAESTGVALEVQLEAGQPVQVIPHPVGHYRWCQARIDVSNCPGPEALRAAVQACAGPDVIARIQLHGTLAAAAACDPEALRDALAGQFAHLLLDATGTRTRWDTFDPATVFPPGTIGATYVRLAQAALQGAGPGEQALLAEVLRRGTALLAGREDV